MSEKKESVERLRFLVEWYDRINEARWGDDDLPPPSWDQVRDEHLTPSEEWNFGPEVSFEYWSAYMTSSIIYAAKDLLRSFPPQPNPIKQEKETNNE